MCHLRVAEALAAHLPGLDIPAFFAGSLAPDSGIPNETWTEFDPPKSVTHYLVEGQGEEHIHDLEFYHAYLGILPIIPFDEHSSFLWGYFFHLLTDVLWVDFLWKPSQVEWAELFGKVGKVEAVNQLKEDWYGLDHRFLRDQPDWLPWKIILTLQLTEVPIDHIPLAAINTQFDMIRQYYTEEGPKRVLDRSYPYLNQATMQRVIVDITDRILKIYDHLQAGAVLDGLVSAVSLLTEAEHAPYPIPLGDSVPQLEGGQYG
ncbi:hypothetical protein EG834_20630, partial [bacterium]|nr:hypothetical protein [bacterium]